MGYKRVIEYLVKIKEIVSIEKKSPFYDYFSEIELIKKAYHNMINYIQINKIPFHNFSEKTWDTITGIDYILHSNTANRKKIKKMSKLFD